MSRTHRDNGIDSKYERFQKKYSNRKVRTSEREFCTCAKIDEDMLLSCNMAQKESMRCRSYGYWVGYWRPMRRWLASHVGQNWNQVYSELIAKLKLFSDGNAKEVSRHIVNLVEVTKDPRFGDEIEYCRFYNFYVDDNGLLQRKKRQVKVKQPKCNFRELTNWLGGRVVGKVGDKMYWFLPVTKNKKHRRYNFYNFTDKWKCQWGYSNDYYYRSSGLRYLYLIKKPVLDVDGNVLEIKDVWNEVNSLITRQHRKFTSDELAYWNKIPKYVKDEVLRWSPTNKEIVG